MWSIRHSGEALVPFDLKFPRNFRRNMETQLEAERLVALAVAQNTNSTSMYLVMCGILKMGTWVMMSWLIMWMGDGGIASL